MAIKQSEIAKAWGVDKGYVSRLAKRKGKKFDSLEEANQYREEIAKQGIGLRSRSTNLAGKSTFSPQAQTKPNEAESDVLLEALKRVENNEKVAYAALAQSVNNRERSNFKILTANYTAAFKALVDARILYQQAQIREGKLVRADEVMERFNRILQGIRTMADSMPKALAARCNPTDPELAISAIEDYIENQFLKAVYQPSL